MNIRGFLGSAIKLFVPSGIIFFLVFLCVRFLPNPGVYFSHIKPVYPYILYPGGFLLAFRFHRNRSILVLLVLLIADKGPTYLPRLFHQDQNLILGYLSLLVPLNIVLVRILRDRRLSTFRGFINLLLIIVQIPVIAMFHIYLSQNNSNAIKHLTGNNFSIFHITFAAACAHLVGLILLSAIFLMHRSRTDAGYFWVIVSVFFGFNSYSSSQNAWIFFTGAGIIVVVSILESIYRMAYYDELTGLPGRRALNEMMGQIGSRYAIAMADIDHFKKFNDTYGHDIGDQVLQMVASRLPSVGKGGKAFRYGGEEFAIIFPSKTVEQVVPNLEKVRKKIAASAFTIRKWRRPGKNRPKPVKRRKKTARKVKVTVSIGVAESSEKLVTPQDVIKASDKALYKAKKMGRNRVSQFS